MTNPDECDSQSTAEVLGNERYLTLSQAAAALPGHPHLSTLHRWRLRGVRGIRLETCLIGGRRFTTDKWLRDFIEAKAPQIAPTPSGHQQAIDQLDSARI